MIKNSRDRLYKKLLESQDGKCSICGSFPKRNGPRFAIDHDHATGKIRGVLCSRCNRGIGLFKENPQWLRRAAEYIENHESHFTNETIPLYKRIKGVTDITGPITIKEIADMVRSTQKEVVSAIKNTKNTFLCYQDGRVW